MNDASPRDVGGKRPSGFVLIGVVMFVLALTILGLSLFGLSSYEAQFYQQSNDKAQAFYLANGGLDWVRFVLVSKRTLQSVSLPYCTYPEGIVYAKARYADGGQESTGTIDFAQGRTIEMRAMSEVHGARQFVRAYFTPNSDFDCYKRLATAYDDVGFGGLLNNVSHAFAYGGVMENSTDTLTWAMAGKSPMYLAHADSVPMPAVSSYLASHFNGAQDTPVQSSPYKLYAGASPYRFFRTRALPSAPNSFWDQLNAHPVIDVQGTVIWMFDRGMRFDNHVTVTGSGCLIIVAKDGFFPFAGSGENAGIYFFGGIDSDQVPVFLVTDSIARDDQGANNTNGTTEIDYVSIFANEVSIVGPPGSGSMSLHHDPSSPNDQPGGLIDRLYDQGLLPNSVGSGFSPVHGQWAQLDPYQPLN